MSQDSRPTPALFTQVDITAGAQVNRAAAHDAAAEEHTSLLKNILAAQDRQNELLEELVNQMSGAQKQRNQELVQWKQANPELARSCRLAAEALSQVQVEFLSNMTHEIRDNAEVLMDGEFMLNEFVDRFGPRLAHLNGVLQILAQLGSAPAQSNQ
jgi:signal transduction histidine kinase